MSRKYALTSTGPLSGKSTLAKRLAREYGFIHADHSRTLVDSFVQWANRLPDPERSGLVLPITAEKVYANKDFYRVMLQDHGNRIGFNDPSKAKLWAMQTLAHSGCKITQARCPGSKPVVCPDRDVVFDSFRGEDQAQVMRELGFTLVQLEISEDERMYRAMMSGASYPKILRAMVEHPELELGIMHPDIRLNGEWDADRLARELAWRPLAIGDM